MTSAAFGDEQLEFRAVARAFFAEVADESALRRAMATDEGFDRAVWTRLAAELGAAGLVIPTAFGGEGFTWTELGILLEEAGRALYGGPLLSTAVLATTALLASDDEDAMQAHLPGIAAGDTVATVALTEASGSWDPADVTTAAAPHPDGTWTLRGEKHHVIDGGTAGLLLVPACTTRGLSLFAVRSDAAGLTRAASATLDQTRRLAVVALEGTPGHLVGADGAGAGILARVLDVAAVALALEQAGGARAALEMSVAHLKNRVQFGQPIGTFQALKHMAADVLVEVESATSAAYYALDALVTGSAEFELAASLAQAYASEAFVTAAHQNVQFHGGLGFTWEASPHLFFKRARSSELFLGDAAWHRRRMAERMGI